MDLLKNRDGLMMGICNGFQALVKLGLVPYGEIRPMDDTCPTLTYNLIGRHQSSYVTTRVASVQSPWMLKSNVGDLPEDIITAPEVVRPMLCRLNRMSRWRKRSPQKRPRRTTRAPRCSENKERCKRVWITPCVKSCWKFPKWI